MASTPRSTPPVGFAWQSWSVCTRLPTAHGSLEAPPGTLYDAVSYPDFDFWLALEGRSAVTALGCSWPFDAGTCFLLPPRVGAGQRVHPETSFRMAYFHFTVSLQGKVIRDARRFMQPDPPTLKLPGVPRLGLFATLDTATLAARLLRVARRADEGAQLQAQSLVLGALAEHRNGLTRPAGERAGGVSVVDAALQYLENNLHRPVFVAQVARHLRISGTHLTRSLRAELGETPIQILTRLRLARAHDLMLNPRLNISEIAAACGFESLSFFSRVFREHHGSPPTAYRRDLQKLTSR